MIGIQPRRNSGRFAERDAVALQSMTDRFKKAGLPGLFHDTTMAFLAELLGDLRAPGRGISIVAYSAHWDVVLGISTGGKPGIVAEVVFQELDARAVRFALLDG